MSTNRSTFKRWDRWKLAVTGGIVISGAVLPSYIARGSVSTDVVLVVLAGAVGITMLLMLLFYADDRKRHRRE